jgi:hypothetical protein
MSVQSEPRIGRFESWFDHWSVYLTTLVGTPLTKQNCIRVDYIQDIPATIQSRMFCIRFSLLSKNTKIKMYGTVTLSAVLYGCETWYVTLREEHSLRVFKNRVLRKIFGPNLW